jgi:hypothetical protein
MRKIYLLLSFVFVMSVFSCSKDDDKSCASCTTTEDGVKTTEKVCDDSQEFKDAVAEAKEGGTTLTWDSYVQIIKAMDALDENMTCTY